MTYIGEHTWASHLGYVLTAASFAFAFFAALSFFLGAKKDDAPWTSLGRLLFRLHAAAVGGIVVLLFILLFNHWFEFDYVWKHSNRSMPMRYILSCFWEGQEGSFLLWTFWHMVIGLVLLRRAGAQWVAPVMAIIAFVQAWLASMLWGIHVFDVRIGSNPFILIRELKENVGLPWTQMANYLQAIPQFGDGRGLNPLLQNYWMVIHPPTLFLGFACTLVPFAFAMAGLWKQRYKEWIAPALPWTFFGVMVLGTGILMGGAWAYEALSFGGFWAWDPVENGSLVPWLVLVGAGHVMVINQRKETTSIFTALLLVVLAFMLVLYSTFLTRSGVLGDTSVHSFTGEGYEAHLLFFMFSLLLIAVGLLNTNATNRRFYALLSVLILVIGLTLQVHVAAVLVFLAVSVAMTVIGYTTRPYDRGAEEENLWTREFWIFIGSLVLLLSAVQITWSTSLPVFNILMEPFGFLEKRATPPDPIAHYNRWQIPFAFIISILVGFGQYLRYKNTDLRAFGRSLLLPAVITVLLMVTICLAVGYRLPHYVIVPEPDTQRPVERLVWPDGPAMLLLLATLFAAVANAGYFIRVLKGKLKNAGPSIAHVGFALVLCGALISTSKKEEVSRNISGPDLRMFNDPKADAKTAFSNDRDALLYLGDTVPMGDHFVTLQGKRQEGVNLYFDMDYLAAEPSTFRAGDTVRVHSSLFVATRDHTASDNFIQDQPGNWQELEVFNKRDVWHAPDWSAKRPGERQFALAPLVQLNPRFGNVAEPSTRHWLQKDLYTHIRFADLATDDTTGYMEPRLYEKSIGDTIVTPTSVILIDSLRSVRDSVTIARLGPEFIVYQAIMRVRDLYDPERWFEARPIIIYKGSQAAASKPADVPELRQRFDLASVDGRRIGLNVLDREFVVMQAIIFPGINVLWIGCILMALGTFMAVRRRWLQGRAE